MSKRWAHRLYGWVAVVLGVGVGGKDGVKVRMVEDDKNISMGAMHGLRIVSRYE